MKCCPVTPVELGFILLVIVIPGALGAWYLSEPFWKMTAIVVTAMAAGLIVWQAIIRIAARRHDRNDQGGKP